MNISEACAAPAVAEPSTQVTRRVARRRLITGGAEHSSGDRNQQPPRAHPDRGPARQLGRHDAKQDAPA